MAINLAAQRRLREATVRLRQTERQLLAWLGAELYSTEAASLRRQLVGSQATCQHTALNLALQDDADAVARELAASAVLRFKRLQAEEEAYLARIVRRGDDARAVKLAHDIARLRAALGRVFQGGAPAEEIEAMQADLEAKELALGRVSRAYAQHLQVRNANLDDLRASLPALTALLEIRQYRPVDFKTPLRGAVALRRRPGGRLGDP